MLLWISAAGLAGASWFGWLVWQDYDWGEITMPGGEPSGRSSHSSGSQAKTQKNPDLSSSGGTANDLLGSTQTDWNTGQVTANIGQKTDNELVENVNETTNVVESEPDTDHHTDTVAAGPDADLAKTGGDSSPIDGADPSVPVAVDSPSELVEPDAAREDFVVVGLGGIPSSAALTQPTVVPAPEPSAAGSDTVNEDYVVVGQEEEPDDELPEIDLTDYVSQWTPIIPKIAALITHELWPQLRSYLESLPQFGDVNLERVVNAVADDTTPNAVDTDRVGEEAGTGFAFYANLFEQMEAGEEPAEFLPEEADLVLA